MQYRFDQVQQVKSSLSEDSKLSTNIMFVFFLKIIIIFFNLSWKKNKCFSTILSSNIAIAMTGSWMKFKVRPYVYFFKEKAQINDLFSGLGILNISDKFLCLIMASEGQ